jgi:hypothetical protein
MFQNTTSTEYGRLIVSQVTDNIVISTYITHTHPRKPLLSRDSVFVAIKPGVGMKRISTC